MILQQQKPIRVSGTARPGSEVAAQLSGLVSGVTTTNPDGTWNITFAPLDAFPETTLAVTSGSQRIELADVAIGEIWVAAGQSNMEFPLEFDAGRDSAIETLSDADIRFFDVPEISYDGQDRDRDYSEFGRWRRSTPDDIRYFSAVAYYSAQRLAEDISVPIGIIGCNWGGTPAASWTPTERLARGEGRVWLDDYEQGLTEIDVEQEADTFIRHETSDRTRPFGDDLYYRLMREGLEEAEERSLLPVLAAKYVPHVGIHHPNRPGGLFNTMVAPYLTGLSIRGVLWYQGESDVAHPDVYESVLTAVIESWRGVTGDSATPFLIVQLAPFGGNSFGNGDQFPALRAQQARVTGSVPKTWMISSSDSGDRRDIHPKVKKPIGFRLALCALEHVYGQSISSGAPTFVKARRDDDAVELSFEFADGLHANHEPLPLTVVGPSGDDVDPGEIIVQSGSIRLAGPIPSRSVVSFAWTGFYEVGLKNAGGLPAFPFRVEV